MELDFTQTHPFYDLYSPDWKYYRDHYQGGRHYVELGNYLHKHGVESDASFNNRKQRATDYRNYCQTVISIFKGHNWAKPPIRQLPESLRPLTLDIDRRGTNINEFMKAVDENIQVEGHGLILVDLPFQQKSASSMIKDASDSLKYLPYPIYLSPQSVLNWSMKPDSSEFEWLTIQIQHHYTQGPFQPYKLLSEVYHWTPQQWFRYRLADQGRDNRGRDEWTLVEQGENPFLKVPAFWVYNIKSQEALGESALKDIAPLTNKLINKLSLIDEAEYNSGIPILALYTDMEVDNLGIGRQRGIRLNPGEKLEYIILPPEAIQVIRETCHELRRDIYRIALRQITEKRGTAAVETAQSKRLDRQELISYCRERAQNLQEAEEKLWRLIAGGFQLTGGQDPSLLDEIKISYNKEFDVASLSDELQNALDISSLNIPSPTFRQKFFTKVAKSYLEDLSPEDLQNIISELKRS